MLGVEGAAAREGDAGARPGRDLRAWLLESIASRQSEATDYEASGGAFRNPLSRLRPLGLVAGRSDVRAADEFFG